MTSSYCSSDHFCIHDRALTRSIALTCKLLNMVQKIHVVFCTVCSFGIILFPSMRMLHLLLFKFFFACHPRCQQSWIMNILITFNAPLSYTAFLTPCCIHCKRMLVITHSFDQHPSRNHPFLLVLNAQKKKARKPHEGAAPVLPSVLWYENLLMNTVKPLTFANF